MALLQVKGLTKYFGSDELFSDLDFEIHSGEKLGLIGKNGCGKTTLINILTGTEDYDGGEIGWAQHTAFGYLPQILVFDEQTTVYLELRSIFKDLDDLQLRLNQVQEQMNQSGLSDGQLEELVNLHHQLLDEFETGGGYQVEGRIQGVLRGLGFPKERWNDSVSVLSGGERTRLALARMLLKRHDLLFLDEPTNYLDIEAVEWLEKFLISYQGAVLLVSHDRYFLDRVAEGFLEMEFGSLKRYRGNYSSYRQQKVLAYQAAIKAFEKQDKEIQRLEKFVRESRATEKSKRKAHSIEKRIDKIERINKPQLDKNSFKFDFKSVSSSSRQVLEVSGLSKRFGSKVLLDQAELQIEAGEKIGLIGPNGAGKTTLLNIILGYESSDSGLVRLGYEVHPGYFSQLDEAEAAGTPFDQVMAGTNLDNTQVRTILGRFLFRGDDAFKSVRDLSGGERRRLGLLKLMLSNANFLVLDEPTNHLDLESIEVIEQALQNTEHTVLLVSHDRYFLKQVVSRYLALIDGKLRSFQNYDDYLQWKEQHELIEDAEVRTKTQAQIHRENTKEAQRQLRRIERELAKVEAEIDAAEKLQTELGELLNDSAINTDYQKSAVLGAELEEVETKLQTLYEQWEELQENLIAFEN